jgi:hypothetical protein
VAAWPGDEGNLSDRVRKRTTVVTVILSEAKNLSFAGETLRFA